MTKVYIDNNNLMIPLDEATKNIFEKTLPLTGAFLEYFIALLRSILLVFSAAGEEEVAIYGDRILRGEDPQKLVNSFLQSMGVTFEQFLLNIGKDIEFPSAEELGKLLGWNKEE